MATTGSNSNSLQHTGGSTASTMTTTTSSGTLRRDDESSGTGNGRMEGRNSLLGSGNGRSPSPSNATSSNVFDNTTEETHWSIVKQSSLKRLKISRSPFAKVAATERFFVLKQAPLVQLVRTRCVECRTELNATRAFEAGLECRARFALDMFESEKKFRKHGFSACRKSIDLFGLFHVKRCTYTKCKLCVSLYTATASVHLAFSNDEQLAEWLDALIDVLSQLAIDAQQVSAPYTIECAACSKRYDFWASVQHKLLRLEFVGVWEVTTKNKDLAQARRELAGRWRLALTENEVLLIRINEQTPEWMFQIPCIRSCTHYLDNTFSLDLGRAAPTGEGRLYFEMLDEQDAKNVHDSLFGKMNSCSQRAGLDQRNVQNATTRRRRTRPVSQPMTAGGTPSQSQSQAKSNRTSEIQPHAETGYPSNRIDDMPTVTMTPTPSCNLQSKRASQKSSSAVSTRLSSRMSESVSNASSSLSVASASLHPQSGAFSASPAPSVTNSSRKLSAGQSMATSFHSNAVQPPTMPFEDAYAETQVPLQMQLQSQARAELRGNFVWQPHNRVSLDVTVAARPDVEIDDAVNDPFRKRSISDATRQKPYSHLALTAAGVKPRGNKHLSARPTGGQSLALTNVDETLPLAYRIANPSDGSPLPTPSGSPSPSTASGIHSGSARGSRVSVMTAGGVNAASSRSQLYRNADLSLSASASMMSQQSVASACASASALANNSSRRSSAALGVGGEGSQQVRKSASAYTPQPQSHLTPSHSAGGSSSAANSGRSSALDAASGGDYLEMSPAHTQSRSPCPGPLSHSSLAASNLADQSLSDGVSSASASACSSVVGGATIGSAPRRYTTGDASSLFPDRVNRFRQQRDQVAAQPNATPNANANVTITSSNSEELECDRATAEVVHPLRIANPPRIGIERSQAEFTDAEADAEYNRLKERSHSVGSAGLLRVRPALPHLHSRRAAAQQRERERERSSVSPSGMQAAQSATGTPNAPQRVANAGMMNTLTSLFSGHSKRERERERDRDRTVAQPCTVSTASNTVNTAQTQGTDQQSTGVPMRSNASSSGGRHHHSHAHRNSAQASSTAAQGNTQTTATSSGGGGMIFDTSNRHELMEVSFPPRANRTRPQTTICTYDSANGERLVEMESETDQRADESLLGHDSSAVDAIDECAGLSNRGESDGVEDSSPSRSRADSNPESAALANTAKLRSGLAPPGGAVRKSSKSSLSSALRDMLRIPSNSSSTSRLPATAATRGAEADEPADEYFVLKPEVKGPVAPSRNVDADADIDTYLPLGPADFARAAKPETQRGRSTGTVTGTGAGAAPAAALSPLPVVQSQQSVASDLSFNFDRSSIDSREADSLNDAHDYANVGIESVSREIKCSPNDIRAIMNMQAPASGAATAAGARSPSSLSSTSAGSAQVRANAAAASARLCSSKALSNAPNASRAAKPLDGSITSFASVESERAEMVPASNNSSAERQLHYATLDFGTPPQTGRQQIASRDQHRLSGSGLGTGSAQPSTGGHRALMSVSSGNQPSAGATLFATTTPLSRITIHSASSSSSNSNSAEYAAPIFASPDQPLQPLALSINRFSNAAGSSVSSAKATPSNEDAPYVDFDPRQPDAAN